MTQRFACSAVKEAAAWLSVLAHCPSVSDVMVSFETIEHPKNWPMSAWKEDIIRLDYVRGDIENHKQRAEDTPA